MYTDRSASFHALHLEIDSDGRLRTKPYDKIDDFNFLMVNFPFICTVATFQQHLHIEYIYIYISQLMRYSRTCGSYQDFLDRGLLLVAAANKEPTYSRVPIG
jgi:hypothetical protein